MHENAYTAQCVAEETRHTEQHSDQNVKFTLFARALGTFAIGTGEFGTNGVIQLLAADLSVSVPVSTYAARLAKTSSRAFRPAG
ncbi:hypothetical protein D8S82_15200 [Mycobacterium hodleri]|uniref:MFS transporter n=1 Tax=Mycolicibacterium hodleri TaxID=49897 RepID=A0A544W0D6_9MYCO|nr:hypothetical protein [Mycolicibacterium hodleri]TQR85680.1 hypothetical protein D8S82_15200 [Mycolicibacterium hodleri]